MESAVRGLLMGALAALAVSLAALAVPLPADAAGSAKKDGDDAAFAAGQKLVEAGDFSAARRKFERALRQDRKNPDVLNMLAYTQRKTGQLDQAIANYRKALKLRSDFKQAHEYLAEAYLQAAMRQLTILEQYGDAAKAERAQFEDALRAAAAQLPTPPANKPTPGW